VLRLVACSIVLASAPVVADPSADAAEASRLFEEGRTLSKQGDHRGACDKFAKSLALDRAVGTELNLADCNERLGRVAEAWRLFDHAAGELTRGSDDRATFARSRADALASRLMSVVIKLPQPTSPNVKVTIAGRDVQPAAEIHDRVEPGSVEVVVTAPTRARFVQTLRGVAGATVTVDVPADDEPVRDTTTELRRSRVHIAWGLTAGAGLSAIASTVLIIKAKRDYDHAVGTYCSRTPDNQLQCLPPGHTGIADSQRLGWISTGLAAGAAVLAASAAVVYFTAPRDAVVVTPVAGESTVGLMLSGRF
jgi:hypothetical protein